MSHQQSHHSPHHHHRSQAGAGPRVVSQVRGGPDEIAHHLSALAEALRSGGVRIRVGDRAVGLRLGDQLTLELLAEAGDDHAGRIVMLLAWQAPRAGLAAPPLHISSLPPAGQPEPDEPLSTPLDPEHQSPAARLENASPTSESDSPG